MIKHSKPLYFNLCTWFKPFCATIMRMWNVSRRDKSQKYVSGEIHTSFSPTPCCDHRPELMPFLWNCLHHRGQILLSSQNTHRLKLPDRSKGRRSGPNSWCYKFRLKSDNWVKWNVTFRHPMYLLIIQRIYIEQLTVTFVIFPSQLVYKGQNLN